MSPDPATKRPKNPAIQQTKSQVAPLRDRDDTGRGYVIGRPAGPPLSAVESVRAERIHRAVFGHAKIVHVLEGAAHIETATGIHELTPGYAMALGAGMWCSVRPDPCLLYTSPSPRD